MRFSFLILLYCVTGAARAASAPFVPADDSVVLERQSIPKANIAGLHALREQQKALAAKPDDFVAATAFARAAIMLGRSEADPRYFGYAESALRPWSALPSPPPEALLLRATLRQQRHDFTGALADLDTLIAANANDAQSRLTRAIVLMVQGRPADALRDCASLVTRASGVTAATCLAQVRSLDGHMATARTTIAAAVVKAGDVSPAERLWAETTAGEIAQRAGDMADAERQFRAAIAETETLGQRDPYLLTAWADFLIARHREAEVLPLLSPLLRIDNALLRLAIAEDRIGDSHAAAHIQLLQDRFDETRQRGDTVHLREETMFELLLRHDAKRAVELGTQNWQTQREPADARILLEACVAAKQPDAAAPVLDWMKVTGIEDVDLHALAAKQQANGAGS